MQSSTREELSRGVYLTSVTTGKFKTGVISVNLITQLDRENAAGNALVPMVLCRGTSSHPDMDSIRSATDELYGTRVEPIVRKKGELQCVGLFTDFVDDDYVGSGENILERAAGLAGEFILSPNTRGGLLLGKYVEGEKENLIDEIRAVINDKRAYSVDRMLDHMCSRENYGSPKRGTEDAAAAITPLTLTRRYQRLLAESKIEIFYCGAAPFARVISAVREAFAALPRKSAVSVPGTEVILKPSEPPKLVAEALAVNQGKLTMGFRLGECMTRPDYAAMMVFNALFGGSVTSKLFMNVRERLSLCYYASSSIDKHKGVMVVSSGVEFDRFDAAREEILAQLAAVKRGDISDWELISAKRAVITSIQSALDTPSGMEELYFDSAIAGISIAPHELAAIADGVTRHDIAAVAGGVELDTVYTLTGNGGAESEA